MKGFNLAAINFHDSSWLLIHSTSPLSSLSVPQPSCTWEALSRRGKLLWARWHFPLNWQEKGFPLKMAKNQFVIRYWTGFRVFLALSDGHQSLNRIHFHYCWTAMTEPLNFKEKNQQAITTKCTLSRILIRMSRCFSIALLTGTNLVFTCFLLVLIL